MVQATEEEQSRDAIGAVGAGALIGMAGWMIESAFFLGGKYGYLLPSHLGGAGRLLVGGLIYWLVLGSLFAAAAVLLSTLVSILGRGRCSVQWKAPLIALYATGPVMAVVLGPLRPLLYRICQVAGSGAELVLDVTAVAIALAVFTAFTRILSAAERVLRTSYKLVMGLALIGAPSALAAGMVLALARPTGPPAPWTPEVEAAVAPVEAPDERPNILLVTVECLRADHVNRLGYAGATTTPNLDRFSSQGVIFSNYFSQSSWTKPSVTSILTSLYPEQHGLMSEEDQARGLDVDCPTLPKVLAHAGYTTFMASANVQAVDTGYGFGTLVAPWDFGPSDPLYFSVLSGRPYRAAALVHKVAQKFSRYVFPKETLHWYVDAPRMNALFLSWLASAPRPFFAHLHYLDPHTPYLDHPYRTIQSAECSPERRAEVVDLYDGEVAYFDEAFGALVHALDEQGVLADTLVVLLGDHGEEFHEHGGWFHGATLFQEAIRVPLVMVCAERVVPGLVIEAPVAAVDVAPTLLDVAGCSRPGSFQGRSLLPLLTGEAELDPLPVLSQTSHGGVKVTSMIDGSYKLIMSERAEWTEPRYALYDLAADSQEQVDLHTKEEGNFRRLVARMEEGLERVAAFSLETAEKELSERDIEMLKALGYIH